MAAAPDPEEILRSTSGKENFQRITRLLISGGTSLLREIFDSICPPGNLPTILSNPATKNKLKDAKLTMPQWHCLCPSPGVYGKSADFDVTLLVRLLRTICNLTPPSTGWDALPLSADHSLTADIARIKYYRNSVYGHVNQGMATKDNEFKTLWQEISEALVRIAGQISSTRKTAWQGAIAKYLTDPLTTEDERNVQELKAWYKNDMEVKKSVDNVSERIRRLETAVHEGTDLMKALLSINIDCEAICGPGLQQGVSGNVGNGIPSPQQILSLIASKYLNNLNPSTLEDFNGFMLYMKEMRKVIVVDCKPGSLIITVECGSLKILEELWQDYCTGNLGRVVQECLITEDILKELGLCEIKLITTIDEKDYKDCQKYLAGCSLKKEGTRSYSAYSPGAYEMASAKDKATQATDTTAETEVKEEMASTKDKATQATDTTAETEVKEEMANAKDKTTQTTDTTAETEMKEMSNEKDDFNILLLGETGVGKSTWINVIGNYAKHTKLEDAVNDCTLTFLIPFRFIFTNDEVENMEIAFGEDSNEEFEVGQSATQFPREYTFETETTRYHLIDTPGIGDCRGLEKDKENLDNILAFLTCYEKIKAVVVFLKANNPRLTVAFKFCILELLTHLHESLKSNIIFAFTNSRGTSYRPGDTLHVLKKLLTENNVNITLSPKTYFCFDNEAFRYLACKKKGVKEHDEDVDAYTKSWKKSLEATTKLYEFIKGMEPHETKKTMNVNEARNFIIAMSKPMAEAVELIDRNSKEIEKIKTQCKADDDEIQKFQQRLYFKGLKRKRKHLGHPITVCTHQDCREYKLIGKSKHQETIFSQICHDPCFLKGIPSETTNNSQIRNCKVMVSGRCWRCKHDYRDHMHMTYTTSLVEKTFLSVAVQKEINDLTNMKDKKEKFIAELEKSSKEFEEEKETLFRCASHFGAFLKQNAMIPYNDSFSDYLDLLIKVEETNGVKDKDRIAQLMEDKRTYEMKKQAIIGRTSSPAHSEGKDVTGIEMIYEMKSEVCSLKHIGTDLKETLDGIMYTRKAALQDERKKTHVKVTSTVFGEKAKSVKKWC